MRIRSLKPEYWKDPLLHATPGITAEVREFYMGTWGLADDTGWLRWDVPAIGAELYAYRSVYVRQRQIGEWANRLVALGRLRIEACGHALVVNLTKHQRSAGGSRTDLVWREHQRCTGGQSGQVRTDMDSSGQISMVGKGRVGIGRGGVGGFADTPPSGVRSPRELLDDPSTPEVVRRAAERALLS